MALYTPLRDVELSDEDLAEIEAEVDAYDQQIGQGQMQPESRGLLRQMLRKDRKYHIWEAQDFSAQDWGEAPRGAN